MDFTIVGAGCAGLVMAAQLRRQLPKCHFLVLERAPSLGGTWYHNSYPGCAVNMPCVTYSMSFDPAVTYTRWFPPQMEILQYLQSVAMKYGINERLRLNSEFVEATWSAKTKTWTVVYRDLRTSELFEHQSKFVISAIGQLVEPTYGGVGDIGLFKGDVLHCNIWSEGPDEPDLRGKRVVVIGNGASATQLIPSILPKVQSLTHLIRSPQGYSEGGNPKISKLMIWMFKNVPFFLFAYRCWNFIVLESRFGQFRKTTQGEEIRRKNLQRCYEYTKRTAPQKYWDLLLPDPEGSCKPLTADYGYLEALHVPKLDLIRDSVVRCEPSGVITQSGQLFQADTIIFATGYQTKWHHIKLSGRRSISLAQKWETKEIKHYNTTAAADFPNFFMLYGPNSAPPNMSAIYCFENYVEMILRLTKPILEGRQGSIEVNPQAEADFIEDLRRTMENGVWSLCQQRSWHPSENAYLFPWSNITMYRKTHMRNEGAWVYRGVGEA